MVLSMPPFLWCVLTIVLFPYTERVLARAISGHRTEAVFERYNITDDADLRDAGLTTEAYVSTLPANQASRTWKM